MPDEEISEEEGASPNGDLEVREDSTPFLAGKQARLIWSPGDHFLFAGMSNGRVAPYGVRSRARCVADGNEDDVAVPDPEHLVPYVSCTCGFYGMRLPYQQSINPEYVELECEFSGRVLLGEFGFRAEWQRVLKVIAPKRCFICNKEAVCIGIADDDGTPHQALMWCDRHADETVRRIPLEWLAEDLDLPVEWRTE